MSPDEISLAVVGAHLTGMPLNSELRAMGARFLRAAVTAPCYRLFELSGTSPRKPGLLRVEGGEGAAIAVEIWTLPPAGFGSFVSKIPSPLGIGKLLLEDGSNVSGFLVESVATIGARDISGFGGWKAYQESLAAIA